MVTFEQLVKRLSPKLKGISYKVHWAGYFFNNEDLYQEALLHLWKQYKAGTLSDKTDSYILQGCYFYLKNYMRTALDKVRPISLDEKASFEGESRIDSLLYNNNESTNDYFASLHARMLVDVIYNITG